MRELDARTGQLRCKMARAPDGCVLFSPVSQMALLLAWTNQRPALRAAQSAQKICKKGARQQQQQQQQQQSTSKVKVVFRVLLVTALNVGREGSNYVHARQTSTRGTGCERV